MVVAFRLVERVGSVSGPLVAAALSQVFGHQGAAGVLAIWLFASALGLGLLFLSGKDDPGLV
jgi:MFS-type transporter involved in bile tolerance (Atg22 family)